VRLADSRRPSRPEAEARYRLHRNDPAEPGYLAYLEAFVERAVAPFARAGSRILDFGSGPEPALSLVLRERGYEAESWDPLFAPGRRSLRGAFDLIAVHEVAEHLARPYAAIAGLARRLARGGAIALRTRFHPGDPEVFAGWWYREDPTHISFFEPRTLAAIAARLGGELVLVEEPDLAVLRPGVVASEAGA
jgi:SAM-dependent methyltransferase